MLLFLITVLVLIIYLATKYCGYFLTLHLILHLPPMEKFVTEFNRIRDIMNTMKLYIKHMVSLPCKDRIKEELEKLQIPYGIINLGMVELEGEITLKQREQLKLSLLPFGFKLYDENRGILIEKIQSAIIEMVQISDGHQEMINSVYLSSKLNYDYTYLANIFSEVTGISMQQYIIDSKIERVKELLLLEELNLSEISYKLNYSSVAHLSGQFKKITGLSPTGYKLSMKDLN